MKSTVVHILHAPRCGSTVLYQLLAATSRFSYITNRVDRDFLISLETGTEYPRLGIGTTQIGVFENSFGKTKGDDSPSEGSSLWRYWCGGGHPSELRSSGFLPGREASYIDFVETAVNQTRRPVLFKNAWNTFRIAALSETIPKTVFLWIRRDIYAASLSDYSARLHHGGPGVWNSASPRNFATLRNLPAYKQVVEQQYEFTRATQNALRKIDSKLVLQIWYEDLMATPSETLGFLGQQFEHLGLTREPLHVNSPHFGLRKSADSTLPYETRLSVLDYIMSCDRLSALRYRQ